jgi:hypothetical protein
MESYYEINVSLNGEHHFATAPRSIKTADVCKARMRMFKKRFPESEGFEITATHWECLGYSVFFPEGDK